MSKIHFRILDGAKNVKFFERVNRNYSESLRKTQNCLHSPWSRRGRREKFFCLSGDTDKQKTSGSAGKIFRQRPEIYRESASPDSLQRISCSVTSAPLMSPALAGRIGGENLILIRCKLFHAPSGVPHKWNYVWK
jgi:hypothetical protein